jgi:hypothetical protein
MYTKLYHLHVRAYESPSVHRFEVYVSTMIWKPTRIRRLQLAE